MFLSDIDLRGIAVLSRHGCVFVPFLKGKFHVRFIDREFSCCFCKWVVTEPVDQLDASARAVFIPSAALEMIPPAYPLPSPAI